MCDLPIVDSACRVRIICALREDSRIYGEFQQHIFRHSGSNLPVVAGVSRFPLQKRWNEADRETPDRLGASE